MPKDRLLDKEGFILDFSSKLLVSMTQGFIVNKDTTIHYKAIVETALRLAIVYADTYDQKMDELDEQKVVAEAQLKARKVISDKKKDKVLETAKKQAKKKTTKKTKADKD